MSYVSTSTRIQAVDPALAQGKTQELLAAVKGKMGVIPNALKTMAHAPAVLEGYLAFTSALNRGVLPTAVREQLALVISQTNGCEYCLSAHSFMAKNARLTPEQITAARKGEADDPKVQALLTLAQDIMEYRGDVSDEQLAAAREAGLSNAEIGEVLGHIAMLTLTNYLNELAHTEVDFPRVAVNL